MKLNASLSSVLLLLTTAVVADPPSELSVSSLFSTASSDEIGSPENDSPFYVDPHYTTIAFRGGMFNFDDDLADDIFGGSTMIGFDLKHHFGDLPLAASTSVDVGFGSGEFDFQGFDIDMDVFEVSLRATAYLEPPPGYWGTDDGNFFVNPYVGAGVGFHLVDVRASAGGGAADVSDVALGFHLVAGVDFVFWNRVSVGPELLWWTADLSDMDFGSDQDIGGLAIAASLKFWF